MKTFLYIDGFNLYYSAVKGTPLRWLNPIELAARAFPRNTILQTKFFTAKVAELPGDPHQPTRQLLYWRALHTLPNLEIILGEFRKRIVRMAVVSSFFQHTKQPHRNQSKRPRQPHRLQIHQPLQQRGDEGVQSLSKKLLPEHNKMLY